MTNKIKVTVSLFLAFIISFSAIIPAFSAETTDYKLSDNGKTEIYEYIGDLVEGDNKITVTESKLVYNNFYAEEEGYYYFSEKNYLSFKINDAVDVNSVKADIIILKNSIEEVLGYIVYLKNGNYKFYSEMYSNYKEPAKLNVNIEYLGNKITSAKKVYTLESYDELSTSVNSNGEKTFEICGAVDFTFPTGVSLSTAYTELSGIISKELIYGRNELTVTSLGKPFTLIVGIYNIPDIVSDIKVENPEKNLTIYQYYDGFIECNLDLMIIVFLKDGTKIKTRYDPEFCLFELPNGDKLELSACYSKLNGEYTFIIKSGGKTFRTYELEIHRATLSMNMKMYSVCIESLNHIASGYVKQAFEEIRKCKNLSDFIDFGFKNFCSYIVKSSDYLFSVFEETAQLINFYVA